MGTLLGTCYSKFEWGSNEEEGPGQCQGRQLPKYDACAFNGRRVSPALLTISIYLSPSSWYVYPLYLSIPRRLMSYSSGQTLR